KTGYAAASATFCRIFSGSSMPIVNDHCGASFALSPHSFHRGTPSRFPARSWYASDRAARVAADSGLSRAWLLSARSRLNGPAGTSRRLHGGDGASRDQVETIAASEQADDGRRCHALAQRPRPLRHVLRLERESAERTARQRIEARRNEQQIWTPARQRCVNG